MFAEVVFPLPFRNSFTYSIPSEFQDQVMIGIRVVVPFGKRVLTGFVINVKETTEVKEKIKPIRDVLDTQPIFSKESLKFYEWVSDYYLSSLGEALKNSVPYGLDVESKKTVVSDKEYCAQLLVKEKKENSTRAKLLKVLSERDTYKINYLQKLVKRKSIYSVLKTLEKIGAVTILDEIEDSKIKIKKVKFISLNKSVDEVYEIMPEIERNSPKQVVILLELLSSKKKSIQQSDLLSKTKSNQSSLNSLEKKNLIKIELKEVERVYKETYNEEIQNFDLTEKQSEIINEVSQNINDQKFTTYLLHGITGSGKTQVYIELTKLAVKKKKAALILVPEISLTPQITSRFFNNFGNSVCVIHSRMSLGERYDTWRGIIKGKYNIVIGPRSALFAPLENLGLIVVDEEHDQSYKQYDLVPKYNARDAAVLKAMFSNCPVILGSATPSLESMNNAKTGKYKLIELPERVDNAKLPKIKLIDVTLEKKKNRMVGVFSKTLLEAIDERLTKKENVIILQNRRGFATQVYCDDCGEIDMCESCTVSMVHHINKNIMKCHYCGAVKPVPRACKNCGSMAIKFFGVGTQRVEDEISYHFPNAKVERIDSDTINRKGKLGIILNSFRKGEIDILVGTQIVSKGMDFSNVTLVGVISAETSLWLPDFRADERTFQLLTQVAGRAGRSKEEGEVIIQTQNHKSFVLQKVLDNNYNEFYQKEIMLRQQSQYPPFSRIALIEIKDEDDQKVKQAVNDFHRRLMQFSDKLQILPPNEAIIFKVKGIFRYQIMIKSLRRIDPNGKILRNAIMNAYVDYNQKSRFRDVKVYFDIDPQSVM
ncbi:MAG: primosomal protein N' [Ignavibacteriales bacterium]|nr:primosomal protein N' [Ignavibacteriales bacterium]MCB9259719.1 primosomal protein N' [Ignavibacteriales bacterium]